jgi:hypothetical protein
MRDLDPAEAPAVVTRLGAILATAGARLAVPAPMPNSHPEPDVLLTVQQVATLVRHSVSWVRKNGHRLPGFTQPGGKGTRVAWSRRALEAWATSPTG